MTWCIPFRASSSAIALPTRRADPDNCERLPPPIVRPLSQAIPLRRGATGLLALCALLTACQTTPLAPVASDPSPLPAVAHPAAPDMAHLHVLMINGGGRPSQNFQSHLLHVREMALVVRPGDDQLPSVGG